MDVTNDVTRKKIMQQMARIYTAIIIGLLTIAVLVGSIYTIKAGERGIVFTWGKITGVTNEGIHFKIPIMQTVTKVDIRTRQGEIPAEAASKNLQTVTSTISINFSLDPANLKILWETVGEAYYQKIVIPRVQETVKAVSAQYTAEELLTQRAAVKNDIEESLIGQLQKYNIIVHKGGIQILNFSFSKAFDSAIEEKQVAEQKALTATNKLEQIKIEAEQRLTQARAEAEAIKIQADAIRAQGGKEYINLKAIEKWNGQLPVYNGGNGPIPFLEIK
ncbi:MAG: prohibitin family protein [Chitinispirillia bacterium]|nr:prohibitin family protein [Chitinispirillia bacterium]